ncbi:MAG: choice-of-anchor tandem repeat GloVer-containing protein [Burkholderiaceae bacterium]
MALVAPVGANAQTASAKYRSIHSFDRVHGEHPMGGSLVEGEDGYLYGTASQGRRDDCGVIFKISPRGQYQVLHTFAQKKGQGCQPSGGLVRASDGNFYGTTESSRDGNGAIYSMTPAGLVTTLHVLSPDRHEGAQPRSTLVEADDGRLYGVAEYGGDEKDLGTIYSVSKTGEFRLEYTFTIESDNAGYPIGPLVKGPGGMLYGVTEGGGQHAVGTLFRMDQTGVVTHLHSFAPNEGAYPWSGVIFASDGRFYGTTAYGGAFGAGTVYSSSPEGEVQVVAHFEPAVTGSQSAAALTEGPDKSLLGTTSNGGSSDTGVVFRVGMLGHPEVPLAELHSCGDAAPGQSNCSVPMSSLVRATDGRYYGLSMLGGGSGPDGNSGNVFSLQLK